MLLTPTSSGQCMLRPPPHNPAKTSPQSCQENLSCSLGHLGTDGNIPDSQNASRAQCAHLAETDSWVSNRAPAQGSDWRCLWVEHIPNWLLPGSLRKSKTPFSDLAGFLPGRSISPLSPPQQITPPTCPSHTVSLSPSKSHLSWYCCGTWLEQNSTLHVSMREVKGSFAYLNRLKVRFIITSWAHITVIWSLLQWCQST